MVGTQFNKDPYVFENKNKNNFTSQYINSMYKKKHEGKS